MDIQKHLNINSIDIEKTLFLMEDIEEKIDNYVNTKCYKYLLSTLDFYKNKIDVVLHEADLRKVNAGTLFQFGMDEVGGKIILDEDTYGIMVFITAHALYNAKNSKRTLLNKNDRELIMNDKVEGYRKHIKFILTTIPVLYRNKYGKSLIDELYNIGKSIYPNIEELKYYDDERNDIPFKFSIYRICKYMNKYYMLEGSLAIVLSYLSFKNHPLAYIKKHISYLWKDVESHIYTYRSKILKNISNNNSSYNFSNYNEKPFSVIPNIELIDVTKPILEVVSYSTVFKEIDINTLRYIPNREFNQSENSNDIYTNMLKDESYNIRFEYDKLKELDTEQFLRLKKFEQTRKKSGSEGGK